MCNASDGLSAAAPGRGSSDYRPGGYRPSPADVEALRRSEQARAIHVLATALGWLAREADLNPDRHERPPDAWTLWRLRDVLLGVIDEPHPIDGIRAATAAWATEHQPIDVPNDHPTAMYLTFRRGDDRRQTHVLAANVAIDGSLAYTQRPTSPGSSAAGGSMAKGGAGTHSRSNRSTASAQSSLSHE